MKLRATSLIEVILYMLLLSSMLLGVSGILKEIFVAKDKQEVSLSVEEDAIRVLQLIEYDLKMASSVSAPASGGTAGSTLTMTINPGTSFTRTYTQSGTTITRATNGGAAAVITSGRVLYSNFSVSHISTNASYHVITVSFTATALNTVNRRDMYYQKNYRTSVVLRPNL